MVAPVAPPERASPQSAQPPDQHNAALEDRNDRQKPMLVSETMPLKQLGGGAGGGIGSTLGAEPSTSNLGAAGAPLLYGSRKPAGAGADVSPSGITALTNRSRISNSIPVGCSQRAVVIALTVGG